MRRALTFGLIGGLLAFAGCGGDDDAAPAKTTAASPNRPNRRPTPACRRAKAPAPRPEGTQKRPPAADLAPGKRYDVTF